MSRMMDVYEAGTTTETGGKLGVCIFFCACPPKKTLDPVGKKIQPPTVETEENGVIYAS